MTWVCYGMVWDGLGWLWVRFERGLKCYVVPTGIYLVLKRGSKWYCLGVVLGWFIAICYEYVLHDCVLLSAMALRLAYRLTIQFVCNESYRGIHSPYKPCREPKTCIPLYSIAKTYEIALRSTEPLMPL